MDLVYRDLGQLEEAITYFEQSIAIHNEINSPRAATVRQWLEEPQSQQ